MTKLVETLERHSSKVILAAIVISLLLFIPMTAMAPEEQASQDPSGEVFDLRDDIEDRFQSPVHGSSFIVESRDGDMLTQAALWELYQNEERLRRADERGELAPADLPAQPYLYEAFDPDTNRLAVGLTSIADAVQELLATDPRFGISLEDASDDHVKVAVHHVLSSPETSGLADTLSRNAWSERRVVAGIEIDYWTAEALVFNVLADNQKLGGGTPIIGMGDESVQDKEEFNRNVQDILRGDQRSYRLWGIAIDVNLESNDEGQTAGIFIMLTVIAAVLVVGVSLRSYWATALTGVGLGFLIVWLKGIAALIGIKGGLVIELIVPIAMISLGVDFAVHSLRRYQEEKGLGHPPVRALRLGLAGVAGALVLAMASDGVAFLSNVSAGIEAVVHFGVAASIAVASSFLVLGVVVPLAMMRIDLIRSGGPRRLSIPGRAISVVNGVAVAALSGTAVIFLVAVSPALGMAVLAAVTLGFIVAPLLFIRWRQGMRPQFEGVAGGAEPPVEAPRHRRSSWVESMVVELARFPVLVLLAAAAVTAASVVFALRLEPTFDAKDFFDGGSDFVVSLDMLDRHIGDRGGEPGIVYIMGDLTDPRALAAIQGFVDRLPDNPLLARNAEGEVQTGTTLMSALKRMTQSEYARSRVAEASGLDLTDLDADGIPDTKEQVRAAYDYMVLNGVPVDAQTLFLDPGQARELLFHDRAGGSPNVTMLTVGIVGSREQSNVAAAGAILREELERLEGAPTIARTGLTGSPFTREAQLNAATETLQLSIPIAAAGAFLLLLVAMRSLRFAVVTIIPIGLVVAWLYGLMYLAGFSLNFVTATIGAISIGVGIDYSIHMTERFREELRRAEDRRAALRQAARGSGTALLASAGSSIVGFGIMGFAPMPLFSSYGILTAIMIFLALCASILVLPSLLMLVTGRAADQRVVGMMAAQQGRG